jgi:putative transposase
LKPVGVEASVGSVRKSCDNALAETADGLYKAEDIHRRGPRKPFDAVELAAMEWVGRPGNLRALTI